MNYQQEQVQAPLVDSVAPVADMGLLLLAVLGGTLLYAFDIYRQSRRESCVSLWCFVKDRWPLLVHSFAWAVIGYCIGVWAVNKGLYLNWQVETGQIEKAGLFGIVAELWIPASVGAGYLSHKIPDILNAAGIGAEKKVAK